MDQALALPGLSTAISTSAKIIARGLGSKKRETEAVLPRQRSLRIQVCVTACTIATYVVPPGRTTLDDKGVACRAVTRGTGQGGGRGGAAVVVSRALEIQAQRTGADQGAEVSLHWLCWRVRRQWAACIRDHSYAASLTHKRNPCAKLWVRAATLFLWANISFWCDWSL